MFISIIKSQKKINVMENIDSVPSNVQSARQEASLYVFEDNEAVIKMIIKGRSPTIETFSHVRVIRHTIPTRPEALLCIFEDSEAVIKMIIKGKKPYNETCFQNPQSCS